MNEFWWIVLNVLISKIEKDWKEEAQENAAIADRLRSFDE